MWGTNVIAFGLWFWAVDQGGPVRRHEPDPPPHDFQFPQLENPQLAEPGWYPKLFDYLYISFTNSIAFSPTDAMPLSRRAKALMLAESADLGGDRAARRRAGGQHLHVAAARHEPEPGGGVVEHVASGQRVRLVEVGRAVQLDHRVAVAERKQVDPDEVGTARVGARRCRARTLRAAARPDAASRRGSRSSATRRVRRRAARRRRRSCPRRAAGGRTRRAAPAPGRARRAGGNHGLVAISSKHSRRASSVSQRWTSTPQLPRRGLTTTGGRSSCSVVGAPHVHRPRVRQRRAREQPRGQQLVVGGRERRRAVQHADAAALEPQQVEQARLDPVDGREDVDAPEDDVARTDRRDRVRPDEHDVDAERAPRLDDGEVGRARLGAEHHDPRRVLDGSVHRPGPTGSSTSAAEECSSMRGCYAVSVRRHPAAPRPRLRRSTDGGPLGLGLQVAETVLERLVERLLQRPAEHPGDDPPQRLLGPHVRRLALLLEVPDVRRLDAERLPRPGDDVRTGRRARWSRRSSPARPSSGRPCPRRAGRRPTST